MCGCSPSGKLVQIEYALQAVAAGAPSVGIKGLSDTRTLKDLFLISLPLSHHPSTPKAKNGIVLAVEKKQKSVLYDESSITKVLHCTHRRNFNPGSLIMVAGYRASV